MTITRTPILKTLLILLASLLAMVFLLGLITIVFSPPSKTDAIRMASVFIDFNLRGSKVKDFQVQTGSDCSLSCTFVLNRKKHQELLKHCFEKNYEKRGDSYYLSGRAGVEPGVETAEIMIASPKDLYYCYIE